MTRLFVYGTLRQGHFNYERLGLGRKARYGGSTALRGARLFDLGSYPCMVLTADLRCVVRGELLDIDDESVLASIRRLEEGAGYHMTTVDTEDGPALTFVFAQPPGGSPEILSGDWAAAGA